MLQALPDDVRRWFERLDSQVWIHHKGTGTIRDPSYSLPRFNLITQEWQQIKQMILEYNLLCVPYAGVYGFGITIHDHPKRNGKMPEKILCVAESHIPIPAEKSMSWVGQNLTHTKRNTKLLEFYDLPALEEPEFYEY